MVGPVCGIQGPVSWLLVAALGAGSAECGVERRKRRGEEREKASSGPKGGQKDGMAHRVTDLPDL